MCLFPPQVLIDPTPKASIIASYLRTLLIVQFIHVVASFIGGNYLGGAFDLIVCLVGFCAVRSKEGYSLQQVLCYCIFCGVRFIVTIITSSIAFASTDLGLGDLAAWRFYIVVVTYVMAPFIYVIGCVLSWFLFKELRSVVREMQNSLVGGGGGGDQYSGAGYQQPSSSSSASTSTRPAASSVNSGPSVSSGGGVYQPPSVRAEAVDVSGFRPFAGQGHRLGGT